ncbi:hypothetical protein NLI96_g9003 [Meripilus lineatus]|uniref:Uncharacterized protein n=1 Tax=Meripilus lineatus TaxID=2056292 RepID=A0AAD5UXW5_9APHY|nr:hypothetical protein NLI96_g9003 [Physisporinus lineatus]
MRFSFALALAALATAAVPALSAPYPYDASDLVSKRDYENLMTREEAVELVARELLARKYVAEARGLEARASGKGGKHVASTKRPRSLPTPVIAAREAKGSGKGKPTPKSVHRPRAYPTPAVHARDLEARAPGNSTPKSVHRPRAYPTPAPVVDPRDLEERNLDARSPGKGSNASTREEGNLEAEPLEKEGSIRRTKRPRTLPTGAVY